MFLRTSLWVLVSSALMVGTLLLFKAENDHLMALRQAGNAIKTEQFYWRKAMDDLPATGGQIGIEQLQSYRDATGEEAYWLDNLGQVKAATNQGLWSRLVKGELALDQPRQEFWQDGEAVYAAVILPVRQPEQGLSGALVTVADQTLSRNQQRRADLIEAAILLILWLVMAGGLGVYRQRSLAPLEDQVAKLDSLTLGDIGKTLYDEHRHDPIDRLVRAVALYCDEVHQHDLIAAAQARQQQRNELYIRRRMRLLTAMLSPEDRSSLNWDLDRLEAVSQGADPSYGERESGPLGALAKAFARLSGIILQDHHHFAPLMAQRAQDIHILREALQNKEQLALLWHQNDLIRQWHLSSLPAVATPFSQHPCFRLAADLVPVEQGGGGFYDFFFPHPDRLGFLIGEASGRGLPRLMFGALARSLIKAQAAGWGPEGQNPAACLRAVNAMLHGDNPHQLSVSLFYGLLDLQTGQLAYANAGYASPLMIMPDDQIQFINAVLGGAMGESDSVDYESGTQQLDCGARLLLYGQGVIGATDLNQQPFGHEGLWDSLDCVADLAPDKIVAKVLSALTNHVQSTLPDDDMMLLALSFDHPSAPDLSVPPDLSVTPDQPVSPDQAISGEPDRPTALDYDQTPLMPPDEEGPDEEGPNQASPAADRLNISIVNDVAELERVSALVDSFVAGQGLSPKLAFNLNLALEELISITISYGYADSDVHDILISIYIQDDFLVTEIVDDGMMYDPFAQVPDADVGLSADDHPIGGLGVFLIRDFMSRTQYERISDRNVTTLWQDLTGEGMNS
jgi:phosphoserine phosphatase RsbU/P